MKENYYVTTPIAFYFLLFACLLFVSNDEKSLQKLYSFIFFEADIEGTKIPNSHGKNS